MNFLLHLFLQKSGISVYFLLLFFLFSCSEKYIHKPTGIEIHFRVDRNMFPLSWCNDEIHPHAQSLSKGLRTETMDILKDAFNKYPVSVLSQNLKKIYILNELSFYGINYGGTNTHNVVYLVHHYYTREFVEKTFHHEFGAVLMYNYNFDSTAFKALLPDSVIYGHGGLEALQSGKSSLNIDYYFVERGFINEYGSSCVEEDYCTICEQLFKPDEDFWNIYDKHQVIHKKIKFIIDFYNSIDTSYNENYFRSFDRKVL